MNLFFVTFFWLVMFSLDIWYVQHSFIKFGRSANKFLCCFAFVLFALAAIGLVNLPDIGAYKNSYDLFISQRIADNHYEIGYRLLAETFGLLGIPFYVFRVLIITLSLFLFFRGINAFSECMSVSLLYFYTTIFVISYLIQIRTGLGLSIFVGIGIPAYKNKKYLKVILSIILASMFHVSMIILFAPFFFLIFPRNKKIKIFFCLILFLAAYINFFDFLLEFVGNFFSGTKILSYINANGNPKMILSTRDFINFFLLVLFLKKTNENRFDNLMFWALWCGAFFKIFFRGFFEVGTRLNLLFQFPLIFLMPKFVDKNTGWGGGMQKYVLCGVLPPLTFTHG